VPSKISPQDVIVTLIDGGQQGPLPPDCDDDLDWELLEELDTLLDDPFDELLELDDDEMLDDDEDPLDPLDPQPLFEASDRLLPLDPPLCCEPPDLLTEASLWPDPLLSLADGEPLCDPPLSLVDRLPD
jgi:hypothetical protein